MSVIAAERRVKAHAHVVWRCVADLAGDEGLPPDASRVEVVSGEGASLRRRVIPREGRGWQEDVIEWQPEHSFTVRVQTDRFPVALQSLRYTVSIATLLGLSAPFRCIE